MAYDAATRKWTLSGTSFAPGIVWFEGDLHLGNGVYQNSFVATGKIFQHGIEDIQGKILFLHLILPLFFLQ